MTKVPKKLVLIRVLPAAAGLIFWGFVFSGVCPAAALLVRFTALAPALAAAGAAAVIWLVIAAVAGRFYCSIVCPLGIFQDICRLPGRCRKAVPENFTRWRWIVAGFCLGNLIAGGALGMLWFDPYSNFGRMVGGVSLGTVILLIGFAAVSFFKPRWFCRSWCPVGALLKTASHLPLLTLSFNRNCIGCGKCVRNCPAGCIDLERRKIDNGSCLRCLQCIAVCPAVKSGISFRKITRTDMDLSRRKFLVNSALVAVGTAAGAALQRTGCAKLLTPKPRFGVLPPGAGDADKFSSRCTGCLLCVRNCPAQIIVPAAGNFGAVSLDLSKDFCRYDCNRCSEVCPAAAILPQTLRQKQQTRIALAQIDRARCVGCGKCIEACPVPAVTVRRGAPVISVHKCIGCAACFHACPVQAIIITEIDRQETVAVPVDF